MRVLLAEDYGFCFGVERAVNTILDLLRKGEEVYTDGDVVHNRRVMEKLVSKGLKIVDLSDLPEKIDGVFAIRAHGVEIEKKLIVEGKFREVIDLTCPIVKRLFEIASDCVEKGWRVVVFGKEDHAEMRALRGHVSDVLTTSKTLNLNSDRICVLSQTTSSWWEFAEFVKGILESNLSIKELRVVNTICRVTVDRERETEEFSKKCDLVLVVGGKHSANTGKLFRVASKHTRAIWIESPDELEELDLEGMECVAVVSGTSTPSDDVEEIAERISLGGKVDG